MLNALSSDSNILKIASIMKNTAKTADVENISVFLSRSIDVEPTKIRNTKCVPAATANARITRNDGSIAI